MSSPGKFMLITTSPPMGSYTFKYFPSKIGTSGRVNWEPMDVLGGMKPLQYGNREPLRYTVDDAFLDNTDTNQSLRHDVEELLSLTEVVESGQDDSLGRPAILLLAYGDNLESQRRVVLEEIRITEEMFTPQGDLIRARVSLAFVEIQKEEPRLAPQLQAGSFQST